MLRADRLRHELCKLGCVLYQVKGSFILNTAQTCQIHVVQVSMCVTVHPCVDKDSLRPDAAEHHLVIPLQRVWLLPKQVRPQEAAHLPDNFEHCNWSHVHMCPVSPATALALYTSAGPLCKHCCQHQRKAATDRIRSGPDSDLKTLEL